MSARITRLNAALAGHCSIERELGEGGTAHVYLAYDLRHGRKVALKVLKPELAALIGAERFLGEALLHGSELGTDAPSRKRRSDHSAAVGHP